MEQIKAFKSGVGAGPLDVPGAEPNPDGLGRRELVAVRPEPSLPGGAEWVQVTDLDDRTDDPSNLVEIICPTSSFVNEYADVLPKASLARDDSFVSFLGVDYRSSTYGIFRVPISASEVDLMGRETIPGRSTIWRQWSASHVARIES